MAKEKLYTAIKLKIHYQHVIIRRLGSTTFRRLIAINIIYCITMPKSLIEYIRVICSITKFFFTAFDYQVSYY